MPLPVDARIRSVTVTVEEQPVHALSRYEKLHRVREKHDERQREPCCISVLVTGVKIVQDVYGNITDSGRSISVHL